MLTFGVGCGILSLSRGEAIRKGQRSQRARSSKKSKKPLDKPPDLCYNKGVKRKGLVNSQSGRCFSPRKFLEKSSKNLLTNSLKCDTIRVQKVRDGNGKNRSPRERCKTSSRWPDRKVCRFAVYKCEPEPFSWRNDGLCLLQSKKNSKYPLTKRSRCGIMNVQGKGRTTSPSRKKSQEKVEKNLLTNSTECGIIRM
jgi:hypothetical protein